MADNSGSKPIVYNIRAKNSNVIVGDFTTITILQPKEDADDDMTRAINALPKLSTLPGKPFHKCFQRSREVEEMWCMYDDISDENEPVVTSLYLTGPPGSGKTQLARQFGEKFLKDTSDCNGHRPLVITINVESIKTLLKSTKDLLHQLKLLKTDVFTKEGDEVVQMHVEELRKIFIQYPGKWLLILDNMFCNQDFKGILPEAGCENWGDGKIIVTSQNSDLGPTSHEHAKTYSLRSGLQENDALNLMKKISNLEIDEYATSLAREFDFFPLSLACTATYVSQMIMDRPSSNYSWEKFLKMYRQQKPKFQNFEAANVYPHSMVVAARLAVTRLAEYSDALRHAFDFLSYCTISPVPLVIVSNFVQASLSSGTISDEIIAEISRCSLLSNASSSFETVENIRFHQVMGEAFIQVRDERASVHALTMEERRKEYVSLLCSLQESLEKTIPDYDRDSVVLKQLASPHLKSIINFGKAQQWTECAEFVVILEFLADCLYHVSGVTEAERISYAKLAYEIALRLPVPMKNIQYCHVLKTLGFYYREANYLEEAVVVLEEALRLTRDKDSKEWIRLRSAVLNVVSWTYKLQQKFDLAEQTMKESIDLAKISLGDSHQQVIERLCDFAIIYREKQDLSRAKEVADEARQMAETSTDEWHLTRAKAANYSAKVYLRYAEMTDCPEKKKDLLNDSLTFHADALKIYEKVLGENHIYVAGVCMTYAIVHKKLNDNNRALELVERAENIYQDVEHVVLSSALCYKTEVLLAMGKASDAEKAIKRSIEIENCGRARFLLSDVYLQQERYRESRAIIKEVLARWNSDARFLLSDVYLQQRKYRESRAIIQEVLARWNSGILPASHFWVKHAEEIKQRCNREIFKENLTNFICRLLRIVLFVIPILLGICFAAK